MLTPCCSLRIYGNRLFSASSLYYSVQILNPAQHTWTTSKQLQHQAFNSEYLFALLCPNAHSYKQTLKPPINMRKLSEKRIVNQGIKQKKRTLWYHVHSSKNWRNHLKLSKSHLVMDLQRIYNEFGTSYFSICLP